MSSWIHTREIGLIFILTGICLVVIGGMINMMFSKATELILAAQLISFSPTLALAGIGFILYDIAERISQEKPLEFKTLNK